jgi:MerR family transcriptional regulator, copper efflux regulator
MNIGKAAKLTGVSSKMIRHYETIGLIPSSLRTDAGYRTYSETDLHILRFVKSARSLGFSLEQIRQLLSLWQDKVRASADVKILALTHIKTLTQKINELTEMRDLLLKLTDDCNGDRRPDCPIIRGIAACATDNRTE